MKDRNSDFLNTHTSPSENTRARARNDQDKTSKHKSLESDLFTIKALCVVFFKGDFRFNRNYYTIAIFFQRQSEVN